MAGTDGFIRIYRLRDAGRRLELMHRTPVGETPGALTAFKGRLLAGCGNILRIYELGKKKLLRKCEHRKLPTHIATLSTLGDRIFVGDGQVPLPPSSQPSNVAMEYLTLTLTLQGSLSTTGCNHADIPLQ